MRKNNLSARSTLSVIGLCLMSVMTTSCAKHHHDSHGEFVPDARFAVIPATEWDSQPDSLEGREHTPRLVTIHHAGVLWNAGDVPVKKLQGLQSYGKNEKDWPDVPYHFLISPDGMIYEGRSTDYEPETNTNFDTNGHMNVHLWGNFEEQRVNLEQLESAVYTTAWLIDRFDLNVEEIGGHKDRVGPGETSCPGKDLARYIDDGTFQGWVEDYLEGRKPGIVLKDELPDGPVVFIED